MEAKKPFWKTTSGLLIGCVALAGLALLCVCVIFGVMFLTSPSDGATPKPSSALVSRIITDSVMAKNVQGVSFDPIDVTYAFPATQSVFHAIVTIKDAPNDTMVGVIWSTDKGQRMGEFELKGEGSRNLDFSFQPDGGKLPPGNYKVEIRLNGTTERAMNFTVQEPTAQSSAPPPSALPTITRQAAPSPSATPPAQTKVESKPSGFINSVTMAEGVQGVNKDPLNPTTTFKPNSTFHAVVRTQNAPAGTRFKVAWFTVDVGSAASPDTLLDQTEVTTEGNRNIDFTLAPNNQWPSGTYRAVVYVNDKSETFKTFSVSPSASSSSSAVPVLTECGTIPAGQGSVLVVNYYGQQINYTIAGTLYKIDGNSRKAIHLAPGKQNYSANIPGVGQANGSLDIVAGQCLTQSWANR